MRVGAQSFDAVKAEQGVMKAAGKVSEATKEYFKDGFWSTLKQHGKTLGKVFRNVAVKSWDNFATGGGNAHWRLMKVGAGVVVTLLATSGTAKAYSDAYDISKGWNGRELDSAGLNLVEGTAAAATAIPVASALTNIGPKWLKNIPLKNPLAILAMGSVPIALELTKQLSAGTGIYNWFQFGSHNLFAKNNFSGFSSLNDPVLQKWFKTTFVDGWDVNGLKIPRHLSEYQLIDINTTA